MCGLWWGGGEGRSSGLWDSEDQPLVYVYRPGLHYLNPVPSDYSLSPSSPTDHVHISQEGEERPSFPSSSVYVDLVEHQTREGPHVNHSSRDLYTIPSLFIPVRNHSRVRDLRYNGPGTSDKWTDRDPECVPESRRDDGTRAG